MKSLMTEQPIMGLDHALSEMELALEPVRHVRERLTEPSVLEPAELNTLAPILGLYLLHAERLIIAARVAAFGRKDGER